MTTVASGVKKRCTLLIQLGLFSSVVYALYLGAIFFEWSYVTPTYSTPREVMWHMGILGLAAILYLGIQIATIAARRTGDIGGTNADAIVSFMPLLAIGVWLGIQVSDLGFLGAWDSVSVFQFWALTFGFLSTFIDVVFGNKLLLKLMYLTSDVHLGK